jgi:hypothetical protein
LQALKHYMANWPKMPDEQIRGNDIDAYFSYEKQFSVQLQALLKLAAHRPL